MSRFYATLMDGSEGIWSGELRHITRDGREVVVESRHQLLESSFQKLVLETNRNITERKQAEQERERSLLREHALRVEAERAARSKDEFLATVAAMDLLPTWKPNVLVSDIGIPEEDGYVLIKKVRAPIVRRRR